MKMRKFAPNLVRYFELMFCLSAIASNGCLAEPNQQPFRLHELKLGSVLTAALAPDESRVAVIKSEREVRENSVGTFDVLQIWDFRSEKLLITRKVKFWDTSSGSRTVLVESNFPRSLAYTPDGHHLVYSDGTNAHVFDATDYVEIRNFPLVPLTSAWPGWKVSSMALSPTSAELAVKLQAWGEQGITGGVLISVYSLLSGTPERTWKFETALATDSAGLAWSPNGKRLAFALIPNDGITSGPQVVRKNFPNLRVANVEPEDNMEEIKIGYSAGDIVFVGDNTLATVSDNPALGSSRDDSIRLWDIQGGKLTRKILSPPDGVHYYLRVSQNGRVVIGYIGKDHRNENFVDTVEQKFRLWDTSSWDVLFTSPPIPDPLDARDIRFALSPTGRLVLVWWQSVEASVYVYERQQ